MIHSVVDVGPSTKLTKITGEIREIYDDFFLLFYIP